METAASAELSDSSWKGTPEKKTPLRESWEVRHFSPQRGKKTGKIFDLFCQTSMNNKKREGRLGASAWVQGRLSVGENALRKETLRNGQKSRLVDMARFFQ